MKVIALLAFVMSCTIAVGCRSSTPQPERRTLAWSGWIEDTAVQRGYVKAGDVAQFGCPPGWLGVEDTAAALRGREVSTVFVGSDPRPREGTITCVAQAEFALPQPPTIKETEPQPRRQPLAPVWVEIEPDSTTIGFRSEVSMKAPIYFAQETPCGPRVIGVRLGDLLKWLADPHTAPQRDFLGMTSAGCPEKNGAP